MDRYWFLSWTTYGSRLPGDARGFVSNVWSEFGPEVRHNIPGTPFDADIPALERYARSQLKCPAIFLNQEQAELLLDQFIETANYRSWQLLATAIMANHCHIVVGVPGDPDPKTLLGDFKSYGSRKLNSHWQTPVSDTWWTESGSKRRLKYESSVYAAVRYVIDQPYALVVWTAPIPELGLAGGRISEREHQPPRHP